MFDKLLSLIRGMSYGAAISIAPVILIHHRHLQLFSDNLGWQIKGFFVICVLVGIFTDKTNLFVLLYLFFYTASSALCQKLSITTFVSPYASTIGLLFICLAAIVQINAALKTNKQQKTNPHFSGLILMLGIPLVFSVWLPLIALPGAWIVTNWAKTHNYRNSNN